MKNLDQWWRLAGAGTACLALLAGCGEMKPKLWPFGNDAIQERPRAPANAAEYLCPAGRRIYVRTLDAGAVWLILPEREVRLERIGGETATRFGKGGLVLDLGTDRATLRDGATAPAVECKAGGTDAPASAK